MSLAREHVRGRRHRRPEQLLIVPDWGGGADGLDAARAGCCRSCSLDVVRFGSSVAPLC